MTVVFLFILLLILFILALAATAFICWMAKLTFDWGIVALVWLILLIAAVFVGGGDGWE